ncbi:MAG: DUF2334 domain-containing protein [Clostridia bacterium]|nr:DUF2334 domain-containing protein [Clostridia bacterium]
MKAKKFLSMFLTFSIIISCFASLSVMNVSAHQNFRDEITFDEIDDFNVTGYKYGTGNFTREEGVAAKSLEKYSDNGKLTNFHYNDTSHVDVASAPDTRYGKSLAVYHTATAISTNPYVQVSYTPNEKVYGTLHLTSSLYMTEAAQYIQRALLLRSSENSGWRKYPVLFDYGTGRSIKIFGEASDKQYSPNKWYDFDVIYNIDTMEYHVRIWEDNTLIIDKMGVDGGQQYGYCDLVVLYHTPIKTEYGTQYGYWDNFVFESTNEFNIPTTGTSASKEVFDFENFEKQVNGVTNVGIPASTRGTWSLGYQGTTELEILKTVTDEKTDDMEVAPNLGKSVAFGNFTAYDENNALDGKNDYLYPQFRYNFNSGTWANKFQVAFSARFIQNGTLNLYMKGSNQCNLFRADGHNLYLFGVRDKTFTFNATDWFDINILMDASTGYYSVDIKNRTSPSKPSFHTEAFDSTITTAWARTDKIIYLQEGTGANAKYVYLDNLYWGEASDSDFPETVSIPDATAVATAEAEAAATTYFPFVDTGAGKFVTANLTFAGTAPTFNLGGEAIDISALQPGTYPVTLKLLNAETDTVTLTIDGTDYPVALTALPSSLVLTAPAGEGNTASFTDVTYKTMDSFRITNNLSESLFDPDDDVVINFSTKLVNPSADSIKVYKPTGSISASCEITEKNVTFAPDGKSVTIAFDKAYDTHYHIILDGLTDEFGSTLSDIAEFDTQLPDLVMSGIRFFRGEGETEEALSLLTPGEVKASMNAIANNGTDFGLFFALALYCGDELIVTDATNVDVTSEKSEPVLSVTVPNDGKEYVVKAFAWRADNAKPMFKSRVLRGATEEPIAIIKLDDFGTTSAIGIWNEVATWAKDQDVKMSYGLMGYAIDQATAGKSHAAAVAKLASNPMIEVWSHGYNWQTGYFTSDDEEVQANEFAESNRVATEAGFEMHAFNPPSNGMNETTMKVLNERFTNYKTIMWLTDKAKVDKYQSDDNNFYILYNKINCETGGTGNTETVENLKSRWNEQKEKGSDYVILQLHPGGWSGNRASQERFYEFVLWLRDQGVVFMHPSEYTEYVKGN